MPKYTIWLLRLVLLASIFVLVCLAWAPQNTGYGGWKLTANDKLGHFITFYSLALIVLISFPRTSILILVTCLVMAGFLLELSQPYFGRSSDMKDAAANMIGITAAWIPIGISKLRRTLSEAKEK